jgi:predicted RNA-binding Zn-ribbon protein involved in translation (DUF1610 family)
VEHFENLKPGDWVVVTGHRYKDDDDQPEEPQFSMFGTMMPKPSKPEYSGEPVRIMAVAFPFICVMNNHRPQHALDMRVFRVNKVSMKYVKAMLKGVKQHEQQKWQAQQNMTTVTDVSSQFNLPELKDIISTEGNVTLHYPRMCPVCQETEMNEILTEGEREWKLTCPNCGFEGTRPNKGNDDQS